MKRLDRRGRYHLSDLGDIAAERARCGGLRRRGAYRKPARPDLARPCSPGRRRDQGGDGMIGEDIMVQNAETEHLRQQLLQAQRLSSMGALASSVAHEFNNILTTIINYAKMGLRAEGDQRARTEAFEKILKGSQRAATIVNSMLGFARNQSHQREFTDLAKLVEEVLILTEKDLSKHHIQVEKQFYDRVQAPVVPGQIEQILLNLIINARQAMPRGGRLRLELRANHHSQMAEIRISDTGVGIPPEQLRLIFEPFYTTKEPDENGHGGNGLGLSVCRQIVEQHHGRMRVESVVGKGSAFTVKLPLRVEEERIIESVVHSP